MGGEITLVAYVMRGMRRHWRKAVKHADPFTSGIADISAWLPPAGNVWLELKAAQEWPKRAATPIKFELDDLQKAFLVARRGWLLCRVRNEYLLFDHATANRVVDTPEATREFLRAAAHRVWFRSIVWKEFAKCVGKRYS